MQIKIVKYHFALIEEENIRKPDNTKRLNSTESFTSCKVFIILENNLVIWSYHVKLHILLCPAVPFLGIRMYVLEKFLYPYIRKQVLECL